uniref:DOC domain-containing protein n=1 Tax=Bursaphelenchus xylophilus TaxID=6326 RepID=A0A1I7SC01_BURXY
MIHLRPGLGSWRYSGDFCPPNVVLDLSSEWTEVLATDRLLHLWALEGCQPNHNGQPSCLGRTAETLRLGHGHVIRIAAEGVLDDGQKLKEMASESPVHATVMGGMWWLKLC